MLLVDGIDITHTRLVDLARLADRARPFYDWVEMTFQSSMTSSATLDHLLMTATSTQINNAIQSCYQANTIPPLLFDGIGRTYPHRKACQYFFAWVIRDAPQQRLGPLINKIVKEQQKPKQQVEIEVLTALICEYRKIVKTFAWDAIREVILDRLEGSRRSVKGHEKEILVRAACVGAFQAYFAYHNNYGNYYGVEIVDGQVSLHNAGYDVVVNLLNATGETIRRILIPIKTRETQGGGHAHLFTRDLIAAIHTLRAENQQDYLLVVIMAVNWSLREADVLLQLTEKMF
jgi:hypothetical protein